MANLNYIVIEGPPGAGKALLMDFLAEKRGARKILDDISSNNFLEKFISRPKQYALSVQLSFLMERHQKLREIMQYDLFHDVMISDFLFEKNFIYANVILNKAELVLFNRVAEYFRGELPHPDMVIYIQANKEFIQRKPRTGFRDEMIASLCEAYNHFFFHYEDAPVIVIRPDQLNLKDENDLEEINKFINRDIKNTVYFLKRGELF